MEEQNKDVIGSAMKLMRTLRRKENPAKHESRGAGRLLRVLQENDGMSSRELADRMGIRPASLTEMLNRLEADGILTRQSDPADQRRNRIFIQEKGSVLLKKMKAVRQMEREHINKSLTLDEQEQFVALCEKRVQRGPRRFPDGGGKTEQPKNHGAVAEADVQLSHTLLEAAHRFRAGDHHLIGIRCVSDNTDWTYHR